MFRDVPRLLILAILLVPLPGAVLTDLAVRYVNDEVITAGDILLRNEERRSENQRRGQPLPSGAAEHLLFSRTSLEELTDESLLTQKAGEMGIAPDRDRLNREVMERAKASGRGLGLKEQAWQRRWLERRRTIEIMLDIFAQKAPEPTPAELRAAYAARRLEFTTPPRVFALQIIARASPPGEREEIRNAQRTLMRRTQDAHLGALAEAAKRRVEALLAAAPQAQDTELQGLVEEVAGFAGRDDLKAEDRVLVDQALAIRARLQGLRSREEITESLEALRRSLEELPDPAAREQAFRLAARKGNEAAKDGELGWVEPGTFAADIDPAIFALPAGGISPVCWSGPIAFLVLVSQVEPGRIKDFDEVRGEIERGIQDQRLADVRRQAVGMLRSRASVKDLVPLEEALK